MTFNNLHAQGEAVRHAARRADDATGEVRTTAAALRYAAETDYVRSAAALLRAHLGNRRPPRRLPVARMWPGFRDVWQKQTLGRLGGLWRTIPGHGMLERMRCAPANTVIAQAEALQDSLRGHRKADRMYESYIPTPSGSLVGDFGGRGRSAPTLPGIPDPGHPLNRAFPRGRGVRIQPDRITEFDQLSADRFAVHQRAITFGDAVVALLVDQRAGGTAPQAGRLRGAGRWVAREQALVPSQPTWPAKLNAYQLATVAGLAWLVMVCTALPLTFGKRADLLSHATLLLMGTSLIACAGIGSIYRYGPRLIKAPGPRAVMPGIASALLALVVGQGQGPVANYYFAGPYDRSERQYANECLAASPHRRGAVQISVTDGVLSVTSISGGATLRLGPAEDGGTHPLRPRDQATRAVLDKYGC